MSLKEDTLHRFVDVVRPYLVDQAKAGNTVTYGKLASACRLPKQRTPDIIGAVSEYEDEHHRPLLSAIVVNGSTQLPGAGFFGLPGIPEILRWRRGERVMPAVTQGRKRFARFEQACVFYYWWVHGDDPVS